MIRGGSGLQLTGLSCRIDQRVETRVETTMKQALPSNRSFGWTFTTVFILGALYNAWKGGPCMAALLAGAAPTAAVTLTRESWLTPLNRAWMKVGELMGRVVSPVVLGVIFFGVFTPAGAIMRLI